MKSPFNLPVAMAAALLLVQGVANAVDVQLDNGETISLDPDVVYECEKESLNLGACACVVSIMLEKEEKTSLSLAEMTELANEYPMHYADAKSRCQNVN